MSASVENTSSAVVTAAEQAVQNPNSSDPAAALNALKNLPSPSFENKEFNFSFKGARKADFFEAGPDGKLTDKPKTDEKTGDPLKMPEKRKSFKLMLPVPTWPGFVASMDDAKVREFVMSIVQDEIYLAAREQIDRTPDDSGLAPVNSQAELDVSKLTLEYLANLPPAMRRGGGIAKETWEAFAKDYVEVISANTVRKPDRVATAAKIFLSRFQLVRQDKELIKFLSGTLDMWAEKTENLEEFKGVYDFLMKKGDEFMNADNTSRLEALM